MKSAVTTALLAAFFSLTAFTARAQAITSTDWAAAQLSIPDDVEPTWQLYDSLGDAYMFKGDSSMALYCYGKAIQLNTALNGNLKSYDKLKKYYQQQESSFYLKEEY